MFMNLILIATIFGAIEFWARSNVTQDTLRYVDSREIDNGEYKTQEVKYFSRPTVNSDWTQIALVNHNSDGNELRSTRPLGQSILGVNDHAKYLAFFGCSFTYGESLNDEDTFPYMIQQQSPSFNVYNYALPGASTTNMLSILNKDFATKTPESSGIGIYVYIDWHVRRNIGGVQVMGSKAWAAMLPYYTKDSDGHFTNHGNMYDNLPMGRIYEFLSQISTLKALATDLPILTDNHVEFTSDLIAESQRVMLEARPDSDFYVLIHPLASGEYTKKLFKYLEARNIKYIDGRNFAGFDPGVDYYIDYDRFHPNREINQIIKDGLTAYLNLSNDY
jgi:hypothetical protein